MRRHMGGQDIGVTDWESEVAAQLPNTVALMVIWCDNYVHGWINDFPYVGNGMD